MRFASIAIALIAMASPAGANDISVSFEGVDTQSGSIVVCLWDKKDGYPNCEKGSPLRRIVLPASAVSAIFENVPAGTYAVSAFIDANGNNKLDANFLGIPREAVGMSNNPRIMGPPRFEPSRFTVEGNTAIVLRFRG